MSDKFNKIESKDIKLNDLGEVELSEELAGAVAGGFSPEEEEDESVNVGSCTTNSNCGSKTKEN
ncbi:MAG: hypothetical protein CMK65_02050 [Pseudoalteromonas sp.]|uniref:hypothetical protein n=1 Tax=Pseudoalteromonas sp. TaxID=53249 RepID=UPI000C8B3197|nr:hypothetical protein [Pseudoalteromonas sp.]MAD02398.1 hypothetical protein [Pseudoalteromonas sp.]|tara:strand:+ start:375 stop:566 length:192 start_codon:yes stop_codon:yes gene_type:complete